MRIHETPSNRRQFLRGLAATAAVLAVAACAAPPPNLNLARSRMTDGGRYQADISPNVPQLAVGALHTWTMEVHSADGTPVLDARIAVNGGMPQHGHGYPTQPRVTQNLGGGRYLIEGVKFSMTGWWTMVVQIDGPSGADQLTYNIVL